MMCRSVQLNLLPCKIVSACFEPDVVDLFLASWNATFDDAYDGAEEENAIQVEEMSAFTCISSTVYTISIDEH